MPAVTRTVESFLKPSASVKGEDEVPSVSSSPASTGSAPIQMLRLAQVIKRTGLKKTKIYELQSEGQFPMRVKLTTHAVGWIEHEVQAWLAVRIAKNSPLRPPGRSRLQITTNVSEQMKRG